MAIPCTIRGIGLRKRNSLLSLEGMPRDPAVRRIALRRALPSQSDATRIAVCSLDQRFEE